MASPFDGSEFVDSDYQTGRSPSTAAAGPMGIAAGLFHRPPSRKELDGKVGEAHQRLAELKRAQEELERERAGLEEARRRRVELQTGREEMLQHLTRGVGILEEAEFNARRDAEQMAKTLSDLRDALAKIQSINEESWTQENWNTELTRALTTIENARMEWNGARLKWALLSGVAAAVQAETKAATASGWITPPRNFLDLCKFGLALTWPVALVGLAGLGIFAYWLFR